MAVEWLMASIDLTHLSVHSLVSYLVAFGTPALDAVMPVLPSETAVITLGVTTAGSTDPRVALLVALAAAGAFVGDNASYVIGSWFGPFVERRFFSSERGRRQRAWAERALARRGWTIIIVCRFIPGGRTAVTLVCGMIAYPRKKFVAATAVAGCIWASYAFVIGRFGGKTFAHDEWVALLVAFAISATVTVVVELARRAFGRWRPARRTAAGAGDHSVPRDK